jgi:hypothetical protein
VARYAWCVLLLCAAPVGAQTVTLRGVVTDESGARVPSAKITVSGPGGEKQAEARDDGSYFFPSLPAGDFTVRASAPDLALPQAVKITLNAGVQTLNLLLRVAGTVQQITVAADAVTVSTEAANNVSATTLKGADLDALADDPEDLADDLAALAGPSAGPDGGTIFVDGFSGSELPPKSSIREIRINSNPFSPEYDRLGLGRIEILTKPGADKLRGSIAYNHMDDFWNSRNPYAAQKAPLHLRELETNVGGPLSHRASFTLDVQHHAVDNGSIVNGTTLDPQTLAPVSFTATPVTPQRRWLVVPRLDYQLSKNNTLTVRYSYTGYDIQDAGIGGFNLASRALHIEVGIHQLQVTETAVFGSTVNETRVQFLRRDYQSKANSTDPILQVLGAFTGGGASYAYNQTVQDNGEIQNNTTMIHGAHVVKFGIRLRMFALDDTTPNNFGGTFTFGGALGPQLDANNQPVLDATGQPVMIQIEGIEAYRRTVLFQQLGYSPALIRSLGGGASQFSITQGNPEISGTQLDAGVYVGDDWRVAPNLTLNLGLRYEAQTNIQDLKDWAPRVGLAWAPGGGGQKQPKTVLRAGFGIFYSRFDLSSLLNAERYNGLLERQYVVTNPDFYPNVPPASALAGFEAAQVTWHVDPRFRAPYMMQNAFTVERQLPRGSTLAVTYTRTRGVHQLRSLDFNAPLPGTYDPAMPGSGVYPLGNTNPYLVNTSSGVYDQNQIITNFNARVNKNLTFTGNYTFNHARSNTDGLGTFPANPYNYSGEYGPASSDVHHRVSLQGTINAPWNLVFSPNVNLQSGPPFDITTGSDLYGTTLFNSRPGFATDASKPGVIQTPYGLLDPNPTPDEELVPRNFGRGPGLVSINLRVRKTFNFGPEVKGSTARRYNLSFSMSARNLTNHNNPGAIIGNITSPQFGHANQMAGGANGEGFSENASNRRLEAQARFTF